MLTPEELEYVPQGISKLFRDLQLNIMSDIVERIAYNKEITRTADLEISRLYELGASKRAIKKHIKDTLKLTNREINLIYKNVIWADYARYEQIYKTKGKPWIPFKKNKPLQQLISGIKEQTKAEFKNITQSLGFAVKNAKGAVTFKPIAKFYQETLDNASMQIMSGAYDYNSVIKRAVKQMTDSGLRTVDYASGISNRVEVAARRAVMTGFNQTVGRITEENAEKLGTEYFEVTYHQGARPTHQPWQGRVYSKSELVSVCDYGDVAGLKGANCRHDFHPFFPGISKRLYTDEELDRMNAEENTPKEHKGKQYTTYEATQRQRRIETALRAKREEIHLLEQGGADADDILAKKAKYHGLSSEYAEFSKAMGLPQERQRVNISPFKGVDESIGKPLTKSAKALEKSSASGIINVEKYSSISKTKNFHEAQIHFSEKWNVEIDSSVEELDFTSVKEGLQGIEYVLNEFPKAADSLKRIGTSMDAIMCADYDGNINFNPLCFKERQKAVKSCTSDTHYHPTGNNIMSTGAHETGHILEKALIDKNLGGEQPIGNVFWNSGDEAKKIVKQAVKNTKKLPECKRKRKRELIEEISGYAWDKGNSECLAEAVADYTLNGGKAAPLSKEIWKLLKEELE
ncbi:MAG: phage minor capsid protein [Ruminococcus sp.]|nr:phage minor capsid protein [Ruminococcus sp.]